MDLPLTFLSVWIWAVGGWDSGPINQAGDFQKTFFLKMWNMKVKNVKYKSVQKASGTQNLMTVYTNCQWKVILKCLSMPTRTRGMCWGKNVANGRLESPGGHDYYDGGDNNDDGGDGDDGDGGGVGDDDLSLIHIWRCRRLLTCRSRWSPYH